MDGEDVSTASSIRPARSSAQTLAMLAGVVLIGLGILGFVPGITQQLDKIRLGGPDSDADLLGLAHVSVLLNVFRILIGAAGVAMSRSSRPARRFLLGAGLLHLVATVYGVSIDQASQANFMPVNKEGNWLHFVLGILLLLFAVLSWRSATAAPAASALPADTGQ